jgi:DNA phosphorothioation-associated putative methyltransferase
VSRDLPSPLGWIPQLRLRDRLEHISKARNAQNPEALGALEPLLRIYEGCGRAYLGAVEGANLIKIHRRTGKLSYLVYPEFDKDPHPALDRCVKLNLRTRQLECYDYATSTNPPVLHRKETFLAPDDERREKFARLTAEEEKAELLTEMSSIGTRDGWGRRLTEKGYALKGHRLVRAKPSAPAGGHSTQDGLATNS